MHCEAGKHALTLCSVKSVVYSVCVCGQAGMIPIQMELGGKDACIVCHDADIDLAAKNIVKVCAVINMHRPAWVLVLLTFLVFKSLLCDHTYGTIDQCTAFAASHVNRRMCAGEQKISR